MILSCLILCEVVPFVGITTGGVFATAERLFIGDELSIADGISNFRRFFGEDGQWTALRFLNGELFPFSCSSSICAPKKMMKNQKN